jgi:hypothetical protein
VAFFAKKFAKTCSNKARCTCYNNFHVSKHSAPCCERHLPLKLC